MPRPWQVIRWRRTYGLEIVEGGTQETDRGGWRGKEGRGGEGGLGQLVSNFRLRPSDPIPLELGLG